jgi:hypothetical protein
MTLSLESGSSLLPSFAKWQPSQVTGSTLRFGRDDKGRVALPWSCRTEAVLRVSILRRDTARVSVGAILAGLGADNDDGKPEWTANLAPR